MLTLSVNRPLLNIHSPTSVVPFLHFLPTAREGMFLKVSVILSVIGLMATRSLLTLVTERSVRILLECFLVSIYVYVDVSQNTHIAN